MMVDKLKIIGINSQYSLEPNEDSNNKIVGKY